MKFIVREWMMDKIVFIDPDKTVSEALAIMRRRYIHSLIVDKNAENPQYGIITSTDICDKIIAQERNPVETKVSEIMNTPLVTVDQEMSLKECAQIMKKQHIHHLPVTDNNGTLTGMISATDFLVAAEALGREPGERIT